MSDTDFGSPWTACSTRDFDLGATNWEFATESQEILSVPTAAERDYNPVKNAHRALVIVLTTVCWVGPAAAQDPMAGRRIAKEVCSACHAIDFRTLQALARLAMAANEGGPRVQNEN